MIEPLIISSSFLLGKDLVAKAISNTSNNIFSKRNDNRTVILFKSLLRGY